MRPIIVETGTNHAPFRKELQRTLDWADEHASSLAQVLSSYESRVDSLRLALNALDSSGFNLEPAKEIDEFNAVSHAPVDLVENKACDLAQIEINVGTSERAERSSSKEHPECSSSLDAPESPVQRLGRYTVAELLDHTVQVEEDKEQTRISRCLKFADLGHWDFMVSVCESIAFQSIIGAVILLSTLFIAFEADTELAVIQEKRQDTTAGLRIAVDRSIIACFVLEVIMKILAYRLGFFIGPDWKWNTFDASNAIASVFEIIAESLGGGSSVAGMLRPLRSLKLLRMVKIFKFLRRFRELRLIVANLVHCSVSLGWTAGLVAIVTYVSACIFLQAWVSRARENNGLPSDVFADWGSTSAVMLSLFSGPTDGKDWIQIGEPLRELGAQYYCFFLAYITFFIFVLSNIITSLMVETMMTHSGKDDSDVAMELLKRKRDYVEKVMNIFENCGASSELSFDVFKEHLHETSMLAFAEELGAEPSDLEHLFEVLSCDGRFNVDLNTFVVSCIRMRGAAKSIDMMDTLSTLVRLDTKHAKFEQWTAESLDAIKNEIHDKLDTLVQETQRQRRRPSKDQIQTQALAINQLAFPCKL